MLIIQEKNNNDVIENIDMKNESFSYLLPKSGSRSFLKAAFFYPQSRGRSFATGEPIQRKYYFPLLVNGAVYCEERLKEQRQE